MRIIPEAADPFVAFVAYLLVVIGLLVVFSTSRPGVERTTQLLFLYLTYGVFEVLAKRGAHYAWYVYPIKFLLFFVLLLSWVSSKTELEDRSTPPLRGVVIAYLGLAAVQIFNPYQGNVVVGVLGWLSDFMFVLLYFVAFDLMKDKRFMRRLLWLTAMLGVASAMVCFVEQWIGPDLLALKYPTFVHLTVFTEDGIRYRPFCLVPYMEIFGATAMVSLLASKDRWRIVLYVGIAACVLSSILHAVRISWGTGLLFLAIFVALETRRSIGSAAVVVVCVTGAVQAALDVTGGLLQSSLTSASTPLQTFETDRLGALLDLPRVITTYPLGMGVGNASPGLRLIDSSDVVTLGAHNYLTALAGQMSLLGPTLLLMFSVALLYLGSQVRRREDHRKWQMGLAANIALFGAIVGSFFVGGGLGSYPLNEYFWLSAGIIGRFVGDARLSTMQTVVAPTRPPAGIRLITRRPRRPSLAAFPSGLAK